MAIALNTDRRVSLARYGKLLEILTIAWATTEATIALWSAAQTGSISLAGFGFDSVIEVLSALALFWRMSHEMDHHRRHHAELVSMRLAGGCLIALAVYIFVEAAHALYTHQHAGIGRLGVAVTVAALVCMPLLAREKRRVGHALGSSAMVTDSQQTDFCMYQAAIVLLGLAARWAFGIGWADSVAALILVPILLRAGILGIRGEHCCAHH